MTVILVLVCISMLIAGGFLIAFVWAIRNGQYEDTFSPSVRILFENQKKVDGKKVEKEIDRKK